MARIQNMEKNSVLHIPNLKQVLACSSQFDRTLGSSSAAFLETLSVPVQLTGCSLDFTMHYSYQGCTYSKTRTDCQQA